MELVITIIAIVTAAKIAAVLLVVICRELKERKATPAMKAEDIEVVFNQAVKPACKKEPIKPRYFDLSDVRNVE